MVARIAFGAVAGAVLGLLLEPLLSVIPEIPLIKAFIDSAASELLPVVLTIVGSYIASRIERLDRFIARYVSGIVVAGSLGMAGSLWIDAGFPTQAWALVAVGAAAIATAFLLAFCASVALLAMGGYTPEQALEAGARRDEEAKAIAERALAAGDPELASAILAVDLAGRAGHAYAVGCIGGCVLLPMVGLSVLAAGALSTHYLYGISWPWAVAVGVILLAAALGVINVSDDVGKAHAHQVPLDEKYDEIVPSDDPPSSASGAS